MSRICSTCGRGPRSSVSRSHAKNATKRRLFLNLQSQKVDGKRVKVCVKCMRTAAKVK